MISKAVPTSTIKEINQVFEIVRGSIRLYKKNQYILNKYALEILKIGLV